APLSLRVGISTYVPKDRLLWLRGACPSATLDKEYVVLFRGNLIGPVMSTSAGTRRGVRQVPGDVGLVVVVLVLVLDVLLDVVEGGAASSTTSVGPTRWRTVSGRAGSIPGPSVAVTR